MSLHEACLPDYHELLSVQDPSARAMGVISVAANSRQSAAFVEALQQHDKGKLPPNFFPPNADDNPFSHPQKIRELSNVKTAARAILGRLPFVDNGAIDLSTQSWDKRRLIIEGDLLVPTERIVAVTSFKDWQTGLNNSYNPTREYTPDALGLGPGSLNAIITYAALPRESQPKNDGSLLRVARDTDGEYWGVLDCDGSHRAGSQKLRGDSHIQVAKTVVYTDEAMPQISYGVRARHSTI